jgi:dTDP-4-dehydrorhamnose 3,5-epimerase
MTFTRADIPDVVIIEPDVYRDGRGFFMETYNARRYREAGIAATFVQDNHSRSVGATVRGLHAQHRRPQGKLVRVILGEIFDVAVDIRRGSPTFGRWVGVRLSAGNARQCYIPPGFAHGFCVTSDAAEVEYKCTDFYDPSGELHLLWNDPELGIEWPVTSPLLSEKDLAGRPFRELCDLFPSYDARRGD